MYGVTDPRITWTSGIEVRVIDEGARLTTFIGAFEGIERGVPEDLLAARHAAQRAEALRRTAARDAAAHELQVQDAADVAFLLERLL